MKYSVLSAKKLTKNFDQADKELEVLKKISANFEQNKKYAIIGASGSGKSTLLHILGGLDSPTEGQVTLDEKKISDIKERKKIGFVFQFHYLIHELTVIENIMLMGLIKGKSKKQSKEEALNLLKKFNLEDKADAYPYQLSGGEQQRVSILRSVFSKPKFLLADEPTGNLDEDNASIVVDFLEECQKEWNMGLILCSHDKKVYGRMDQVFELKNGILV